MGLSIKFRVRVFFGFGFGIRFLKMMADVWLVYMNKWWCLSVSSVVYPKAGKPKRSHLGVLAERFLALRGSVWAESSQLSWLGD